MQALHYFANPARFTRLAGVLLPWCVGLTAALLALGVYLSFFASPPDYQQGETVRIMYVHVPTAWISMLVLTAAFVFARASDPTR